MSDREDPRRKKKKRKREGKKRERPEIVVSEKVRKPQTALVFSTTEVRELLSTATNEDVQQERFIYMIFSSRKMTGENFWNLCASHVTNSDTIHVAILFDDGQQCSINTITDAVTMVRVKRLNPSHSVPGTDRCKTIYQFSVSERTYANIQERIRQHIRNQTSYDILSWYMVGIFGTCFNPSRVGARTASANSVTCSRLFYDILRDPEVGIIQADEANDGILPHQLKEMVEESTMGVERVTIDHVNRRLKRVAAVGGVIIAAQDQ